MLSLQGVTLSFGSRKVFDNLTWELAQPGVYLLLGANGCGKTALLNIIAGRRAPDRGKVLLGEVPVYGLFGPDLPRIEYLHREAVAEDAGTLWDLYTHRLRRERRKASPRELLEQFHLPWEMEQMRRLRAAMLPQGELLEFELLCAMSFLPDYLLVDDYLSRFSFDTCERTAYNLLMWHRLTEGTALLTSTRFFGFMDAFTDVFLLEGGKLRSLSPPSPAAGEPAAATSGGEEETVPRTRREVLVLCGEYFYRHSRVEADNEHLVLKAVLENALLIEVKTTLDQALEYLQNQGIDAVSVALSPRMDAQEYNWRRFF